MNMCVEICMLEKPKYQNSCVFVCMCEAFLTSMLSSDHGSVANIPISLEQLIYFCWLCVLPYWLLSLCVLGEMSEVVRAFKNESCPAWSQNVRKQAIESVEYNIGSHVTRPAQNARFIFYAGQNQNTPTQLRAQCTWLLCPIRFPKLFNLQTSHNFFFGNNWVMDPIFLEFFASRGHRRAFKKYKCVNTVKVAFIYVYDKYSY